MAICTKNRFQIFQKLYILYKSSRLARGREAQNYGGVFVWRTPYQSTYS